MADTEVGKNVPTQPIKKRRRKQCRTTAKRHRSEHDRYNEYISMGAAFYSTAGKIVAMACGYTVADHHASLDADRSEHRSFDALLARIEQATQKQQQ